MRLINIVEPNYSIERGHDFSFIEAIVGKSELQPFKIWLNRSGPDFANQQNVKLVKWFYRKLKFFQKLYLIRRTIMKREKLFVVTANTNDLIAINFATRYVPPESIYLYFHLPKKFHPRKTEYYRKFADKYPNVVFLCPTDVVLSNFLDVKIKFAEKINYPINIAYLDNKHYPFSHLLFAGIIRTEKGSRKIARLVEYFNKSELNYPIHMQVDQSLKSYTPDEKKDVEDILNNNYERLVINENALKKRDYYGEFRGAISLLPYDSSIYVGRVSGVALDAILAGSPIITLQGSWVADLVEEYNCGASLKSFDPVNVVGAIETISSNYKIYSDNTFDAAQIIKSEHSPEILFNRISRL